MNTRIILAVEPTEIEQNIKENTKIKASVKLKQSAQRLRVILIQKHLFDTNYFFELETLGDREKRDPYELYRCGGRWGIGYNMDEYTKIIARYRYHYIDVGKIEKNSDINFRSVEGESQVAGLSLELDRRTINDPKYPTKGSHNKLDFEFASRGLGGDYDFNTVSLDSAWYFTPWEKFTFVLHGHSDWADDFGNVRGIPFFERFYAAGSGTVRGHRSRSIGPKGEDKEPIGGKFRAYFNMEMRFPIYKKINGAFFFDTGGAWKKMGDFDTGDFDSGAGVGLRYVVKWWKIYGVARLDYGINLNRHSGESFGRIHTTFGMPF